MSRNPNNTAGGFVAVPSAFEGTPPGVVNALKLELTPKIIEKRIAGSREIALGADVVSSRALLDFAALNVDDIDYDGLERDCDILKEALRSHRKEIGLALGTVHDGRASPDTIGDVAAKLEQAGLTERCFREKGGGLIGLLIAAAAILVLEGCAHLSASHPPPEEVVESGPR